MDVSASQTVHPFSLPPLILIDSIRGDTMKLEVYKG